MYLPRSLISQLYLNLVRTHHPHSPPLLILVALEPDAVCACRILTTLLKRDYVPHKLQPIAGYRDLAAAGQELVRPMQESRGGSGGVVVCLGVGGSVDLQKVLGFDGIGDEGATAADNSSSFNGVTVWVFDSVRPCNLSNIFGGYSSADQRMSTGEDQTIARLTTGIDRGEIQRSYKPGRGGIIVFDDGDIEEDMSTEREAWFALEGMPELDDDDDEGDNADDSDVEERNGRAASHTSTPQRKRKSWSHRDAEDEEDESGKENVRPHQRRRSNSSTPIPSTSSSPRRRRPPRMDDGLLNSTPPSNQEDSQRMVAPRIPPQPSARSLKRRLLRLRRKHTSTLDTYQSLGTSYAGPVSSMLYSLASELGCEDNDILWLALIGVSSAELYGRTATGLSLTDHDAPTRASGWSGNRGSFIRQLLRDEVARLNPPELNERGYEVANGHATDMIPTHARSPTDTSIKLSPEPRFLLVRHWSLYDSMLHSPYLSAKLHIWSDAGRRRLHKLLAKMGVSLTQCKQSYTHMDMELKKILRERLLHFAPVYGMDGLVPPASTGRTDREGWGFVRSWGWKACLSAADVAVITGAILEVGHHNGLSSPSEANDRSGLSSQASTNSAMSNFLAAHAAAATTGSGSEHERFYTAYDAVLSPSALIAAIPLAQSLHRAILRTGTILLQKRQIRHLRAFRMGIVKEGPDVALFSNPGALTKLALWVGEAVREVEKESGKSSAKDGGSTPLVLACLNNDRGVYVVVGLGGGGAASGGATADADREKTKAAREQKREAKRQEREQRRKQHEEEREVERQRRRRLGEDENGEETEEDEEADESSNDESSDNSSGGEEDEDEDGTKKHRASAGRSGRNRFGAAFQEVIDETSARLSLDSFEHCVVEVPKDHLSGFLESLSMKAVVS